MSREHLSLRTEPRRRWSFPRAALVLGLTFAVGAVYAGERALSDPSIVDAVQDELLFDGAVPFNDVDVECHDGVVTLRGTVDNLMARERSARIAETLRGVRAVVNLIEVKQPADLEPKAVKQDVEAALASDPATDSWEIEVAVDALGTVTLTGTVDSWQESILTETVAKTVRGVTEVRNKIDVEFAADRPDFEIEPEIEQRLKWNALVDAYGIDVEVKNGVVTLSGVVGSAAEKRHARYDAWVSGVKKVDDTKLNVRPWAADPDVRKIEHPQRTDDQVRDAVAAALLYDPRVASFNVDVRVRSGMVTLHGIVDNLMAKRAAEQDARHVVGTRMVRNHLKVRPIAALSDDKIETNVAQALSRDPYVFETDLAVRVENGTAHLYGTVDSTYERARAEDAAFRARGVKAVFNHIDVELPAVPAMSDWATSPWYPGWSTYTVVTDATIRETIEDQLWWSPFVDSDQVDVTVNNGVATLTGAVDSWAEYQAAAKNAIEGGARDVNNDLVIR